MNQSYLSRSNVDEIYGYMKNVIQNKKEIDLDSDPKYRKVLKKMMGMIYQHHGMSTSTIRDLNALTVKKTGPYILDLISKDQPMLRNSTPRNTQVKNKTTTRIEPLTPATNNSMGTSFDGAFSQTDEDLLQSLYERESDPQRAQLTTNNKHTNNSSNQGQDFQARLQELEKSRGYTNDSVKTMEEQEKEWRENIRKADAKAEAEARSKHVVANADQILSVISQDNVPSQNGEFNQN